MNINKEAINHPRHYNANASGIECIDVIEDMDFNIGNSIKYIWRSSYKEKLIEDIKKSMWYINREIERRNSFNIIKKIINNVNIQKSKFTKDQIVNISKGLNSIECTNAFLFLYYSSIYKNDIHNLKIASIFLNDYLKQLKTNI